MEEAKPITPGFTETMSISDGIILEHRRGGKILNHRLVTSDRETNLITKEVRIKKEEKHGVS